MSDLQVSLGSKKLYFASDFHLGAPTMHASADREQKIVRWLDMVKGDAAAIFLVGDIFDFWFEYRHVVPKGFIRFQGKLAELSDSGVPIYFFRGNHDMWMKEYFQDELGIQIIDSSMTISTDQIKIFVGHGDGLGPGDHTYKFLKRIFRNPFLQWLFSWVHPNIGMGIANAWSRKSRINHDNREQSTDPDREWLFQHCKQMEKLEHHDLYIFGHRHLPIEMSVGNTSKYINLGEWVSQYTYLELSHQGAELLTFNE